MVLLAAVTLAGCQRERRQPPLGTGYVASSSVNLRDKLAQQQITITTLKQGEKLDVLQRKRKWLQVRTASGVEGWIEDRNMVTQEVFDRFRQLQQKANALPPQGKAHAHRAQSLHLEPNRKSPVYYMLNEEQTCDVVGRAFGERPVRAGQPQGVVTYEDWFLVRMGGAAGWGLASNLDMSVPDEVLQYAEGKRIVAWFVLEPGADPEHPTILWATTSAMGLPYDFDSARVFVWVPRKKHYETSYIDHNLRGYYPILVSKEPVRDPVRDPVRFTLNVQDKTGLRVQRKFEMAANRVKRITR